MSDTIPAEVWRWSEAFLEIVDNLLREPLVEWAGQADWPEQQKRLAWWSHQVNVAQKQYRRGDAAPLRLLYDYWRTIAAHDPSEQVGFPQVTYRELVSR